MYFMMTFFNISLGETSAGKTTLINKVLRKDIFSPKLRESTSTICKIRNSEKVTIVREDMHGSKSTTDITGTCNIQTKDGQQDLRKRLEKTMDLTVSKEGINYRKVEIGFPIPFLEVELTFYLSIKSAKIITIFNS